MENSEKNDFNPKFRVRTRQFAINLCKMLNKPQNGESNRVIVKQIIRSGTSVASNFYAATRARSKGEYYSKLCIVVEECDETFFWLDLLKDAEFMREEQILELYKETEELLKVFSTTKKNLKSKLNPPKK
jgi:four helix bundle protein